MKILEKNSNESVNSIGKGSSLEGSINAPGDIRIEIFIRVSQQRLIGFGSKRMYRRRYSMWVGCYIRRIKSKHPI